MAPKDEDGISLFFPLMPQEAPLDDRGSDMDRRTWRDRRQGPRPEAAHRSGGVELLPDVECRGPTSRRYYFRSFEDRRHRIDRRCYVWKEGDPIEQSTAEPETPMLRSAQTPALPAPDQVHLTPAEIAILLGQDDE